MYGEELDLGYLIHKIGYQAHLAQHAVVLHSPATSSGGALSVLPYHYGSRNRILLARRLLPVWSRGLFHACNALLCAGRLTKNVAAGRVGSARAIAQGTLDGYRGIGGKWRLHDREALKCCGDRINLG
jgi:GT2 family glycosyltransferase